MSKASLTNLAPELLSLIFSYLGVCDFFPLRLVGSHYLISVMKSYPQPKTSLDEYIYELINTGYLSIHVTNRSLDLMLHLYGETRDRMALCIAACRGENIVVISMMERYKRSSRIPSKGPTNQRIPLSFAAEHGHLSTMKIMLGYKGYPAWYRDGYSKSTLDYAAEKGHVNIVQFLIRQGHSVTSSIRRRRFEISDSRGNSNCSGYPGTTTLVWAIRGEQVEMVKFLLSAGATKHLQGEVADNYPDAIPLEEALGTGNMQIVNILLHAGARMNPKMLRVPLQHSINAGRVEMVRYLCQNGVALDKTQAPGRLPLHQACELGNIEIVKLLLNRGAPIAQLSQNTSPLYSAVEAQHIEIVKLLIDRGADVPLDPSKKKPLWVAAEGENYPMMELLLENGAAKGSATEAYGYVAQLQAAPYKSIEQLRILLKYVPTKEGHSPWPHHLGKALISAASCGNKEAVEELLGYGLDINARDIYGLTPLHKASEGGRMVILSLLLTNGADIAIEDNWGRTAAHLAAYASNPQSGAIAALISAGFDTSLRDKSGLTVSDILNRPPPQIDEHWDRGGHGMG